MDVSFRLLDLEKFHPELLWDTIITAAVAVFSEGGRESPFAFVLDVQNVPGFGSEQIRFSFDGLRIPVARVTRLRRTFEPSRLIELAAISVAGAGLAVTGGHRITDVAVRGSAADYLVDAARHHLEIAGRSRRVDLETAWQQKWQRLRSQPSRECYVCVSEFESHTGRLGFATLEGEANEHTADQ